jgi:hypothetical protein
VKQGLHSGLVSGLLSGLNPGGVSYSIATFTPAQAAILAPLLGAPDLMYRGNDASGSTELVAGTDNLTDAATPAKEVYDAVFDMDTTQFSSLSTDAMVAASNAVADATTGNIVVIHICRLMSIVTSTYNLVGKRDNGSPYRGWEMVSPVDGSIQVTVSTSLGAYSRIVAGPHSTTDAQTIMFKRDSAESGLLTREGSTLAAPNGGSLTNPSTFAIGRQRTAAREQSFACTMIWLSPPDGVGETQRLAIAQGLGFE